MHFLNLTLEVNWYETNTMVNSVHNGWLVTVLVVVVLIVEVDCIYIYYCDHNIIVVPATMTFNISSMKRDKWVFDMHVHSAVWCIAMDGINKQFNVFIFVWED